MPVVYDWQGMVCVCVCWGGGGGGLGGGACNLSLKFLHCVGGTSSLSALFKFDTRSANWAKPSIAKWISIN